MGRTEMAGLVRRRHFGYRLSLYRYMTKTVWAQVILGSLNALLLGFWAPRRSANTIMCDCIVHNHIHNVSEHRARWANLFDVHCPFVSRVFEFLLIVDCAVH